MIVADDTGTDRPKMKHQIVVRVSDELYAALEADAHEHGRTVAQSVRFRLRDLEARDER